ncbi:MAG: hypothetical protein DI539_10375 [Flavobacterium psychrophilum]|nr:MAG: hypothetical protein DI539_10375 [Flavobacterium psychrophilum]
MLRLILLYVLLIVNSVTAQSKYETGMQKAFALWGENKTTEASAMFERIAAVEKNNWLPNYYVALINTTEAFMTKDKEKLSGLLAKAQAAQDEASVISPDNPELMVMQCLIYTAWIVYDPMTNGMKYSAKANELYAKALILAPNNPRVVFSKAEFEIGGAAYFGQDTKPMCKEIERAVGLFATFKPETPFHPNWGADRAQEKLKECKK